MSRDSVAYVSRDHRERATGIEPAFSAWEADVLPLNYARNEKDSLSPAHLSLRTRPALRRVGED